MCQMSVAVKIIFKKCAWGKFLKLFGLAVGSQMSNRVKIFFIVRPFEYVLPQKYACRQHLLSSTKLPKHSLSQIKRMELAKGFHFLTPQPTPPIPA